MKKSLIIVTATIGMTSLASVYWQGTPGQPLDWLGTVGGHSYWNADENGAGAWKDFPANENAHVKNGGIVVVGSGVSDRKSVV